MSTEKMTSDEQLDYDNYRDAKTTKQQQNVAETNERVKLTLTVPQFVLGLMLSCCITAVLTAVFQWNVGSKVFVIFDGSYIIKDKITIKRVPKNENTN